jgi:hypothetical protein
MKNKINVLVIFAALLLSACDVVRDFDAAPTENESEFAFHTTPENSVLMDFTGKLKTSDNLLTFPELKKGELTLFQVFGKTFFAYKPSTTFTSDKESFELGGKKVTVFMHKNLDDLCQAGAQFDKIGLNKDQSISLDVLANDKYCGKAEAIGISLVPGKPDYGVAILKDGKLNYTPKPGFVGTDVAFYQLKDGANTSSAMVVFQVQK